MPTLGCVAMWLFVIALMVAFGRARKRVGTRS
jgi:hypothetical protein